MNNQQPPPQTLTIDNEEITYDEEKLQALR